MLTILAKIEEFTIFMRGLVASTVPPNLHSRLRTAELSEESFGTDDGDESDESADQWTLDGAERRMERAYREGGVVRWGEQAVLEFQREREGAGHPKQEVPGV